MLLPLLRPKSTVIEEEEEVEAVTPASAGKTAGQDKPGDAKKVEEPKKSTLAADDLKVFGLTVCGTYFLGGCEIQLKF